MKRLGKLLLAFVLLLVSFVALSSPPLTQAQSSGIAVKCDQQTGIPVNEYVAPRCDGSCPTVGASSIGDGFAWVGMVSNFVEWVDANIFMQHSNDIHFLYEDSGGLIKFMQDTIWGKSDGTFFTCDDNGARAMYRVYDANGNWGRPILRDTMNCGETYTSSGYLKAYEKQAEVETTYNMPLRECPVAGQSDIMTATNNQLIFQGTAVCNSLDPIDVIMTTNLGGAGVGEVYVYCKGYGLCAWYQSIDFTENSPADFDETTDVCNLEAASSSTLRDPYYVEEINGMFDYALNNYEDPQHETMDKIYEDLIAQGYQAYCSIPNLNYIANSNTNRLMLEDIMGIGDQGANPGDEQVTGSRVTVDISNYKQFYNYIDAKAPIWRKKGLYVLNSKNSLETFWSHKNEEERIGLIPLNYSPAFVIASPESQCVEKMKILRAVDTKCNTLQNPATCALDISYHPDALRFWELYKAVNSTGFSCDMMTKADEELNQVQVKIKSSFLNMPFALPTAYRFAFAVYSAELREPRIPSELGEFWTRTTHKPGFDFLRYDPDLLTNMPGAQSLTDQQGKPRSEVRILAFLVPDFATNIDNVDFTYTAPPERNFPAKEAGPVRNHTAKYSPPFNNYADAAKIARNALMTPDQLIDMEEEWAAQKALVTLPAVLESDFNPDDEKTKLIECLYANGEPAPAAYRCEKPMELALTTFINRRIENPEDCNQDVIEWEKNSTIYDDAGIQRADAPLYHLYNGQNVHLLDDGFYPQNVANVIPNSQDTSLDPITDEQKKVYSFRFLSHFSFSSFYDGADPIYRDTQPEKDEDAKATIRGFLVYPQGYELASIENTLLNAFLTPEQIDDFKAEDRNIWFKLKGVVQSLIAPKGSTGGRYMFITEADCQQKYASYVATAPSPPKDYGAFKDSECKKEAEVSLDSEPQNDKEPRILGAWFGAVTIKIQQSLRNVGTSSWDYLTSCLESETPTEDFLLGRCSGVVTSDGKQDDEDEPDSSYMNREVAVCNSSTRGNRVVNDAGEYALSRAEISCNEDDCDPDDPDLDQNCATEYTNSEQGVSRWLDGNDRVSCSNELYSFIACSFNPDTALKPSLIAHKVDERGNFTPDGYKTACDYVQDKAAEQNVSPRLALAIWLEETGTSAYSTETGGADFGAISAPSSRQSGTIQQQLGLFLGTINSNRNYAYPRFLLQYSGENLYDRGTDLTWRDWEPTDRVLFCYNRGFAGRLKSIYEQLGQFSE